MISKRIYPSFWFGGDQSVRLLNLHSRGFDRGQMQKMAASDYIMAIDAKPLKGFSFVHVITTGAGEHYGSNNNADFFNEKEATVEIPEPKTGGDRIVHLCGGLLSFHPTFMKYGAVYHEHVNSRKGGIPQGDIFAESYNPVMHRGEVVLKLSDDHWGADLQKLANGEPVFWSIGCGVPYDICSICGNHARTRKEYCDDMKYNRLGLTKTGHQVFVYNDQPHFHDLSRVAVPADRIAFALRKVASQGDVFVEDPNTGDWLPLGVIQKIGTQTEAGHARALEKAAEIEKRILAQGMTPEQATVSGALGSRKLDPKTVEELQRYPLQDVLFELNKRAVLLPISDFARIVVRKPAEDIPGLGKVGCVLSRLFTGIEDSGVAEVISDAAYTPLNPRSWAGLSAAADAAQRDLSMEEGPIRSRIVKVAMQEPMRKTATVEPGAESKVLAKEYAKYQIAFLTGAGIDKYAFATVLANQSVE